MFLRPLDGFNVQRAIQSGRETSFDISSPPHCDFSSFCLEKVLSKSPDGRMSDPTPHIFQPHLFLLAWTHKWSWQEAISVSEREHEVPAGEVK